MRLSRLTCKPRQTNMPRVGRKAQAKTQKMRSTRAEKADRGEQKILEDFNKGLVKGTQRTSVNFIGQAHTAQDAIEQMYMVSCAMYPSADRKYKAKQRAIREATFKEFSKIEREARIMAKATARGDVPLQEAQPQEDTLESEMAALYADSDSDSNESELVACEPVVSEPAVSESAVCELVVSGPTVCEPIACEPVVSKFVCETIVCEPIACEPVVSKSVWDEPVVVSDSVALPVKVQTFYKPRDHTDRVDQRRAADRSTDRTNNWRATDRSTDRSNDRSTDRSNDRTNWRAADRSNDRTNWRAADRSNDRTDRQRPEQSQWDSIGQRRANY